MGRCNNKTLGRIYRQKGGETMKAAINQVKEINILKEAIAKTQSKYLIIYYEKRIHNLKKELREYCTYRNINYHKLMSE